MQEQYRKKYSIGCCIEAEEFPATQNATSNTTLPCSPLIWYARHFAICSIALTKQVTTAPSNRKWLGNGCSMVSLLSRLSYMVCLFRYGYPGHSGGAINNRHCPWLLFFYLYHRRHIATRWPSCGTALRWWCLPPPSIHSRLQIR